jgi:hypothetical protein
MPPTLVLYGSAEPPKLRHQSDLLFAALERAGAPVERVVAPREGHQSIVLTLSRGDETTVPAILELIDTAPCPARRSPPDS